MSGRGWVEPIVITHARPRGRRCYWPDEEPEREWVEVDAILAGCPSCGGDHPLAECYTVLVPL